MVLCQNIEQLPSKGTTLEFCTASANVLFQAGRPPWGLTLPNTGKNMPLNFKDTSPIHLKASLALTSVIQAALYKARNTL